MGLRSLLASMLCLGAASGAVPASPEPAHDGEMEATPATGRTLQAFRSEAELERLLARWTRRADAQRQRQKTLLASGAVPPSPSPVASEAAAPALLDAVTTTAGRAAGAGESITNVQTAGVDEGGIVKRHGEHLVVLRRGRLFTVRIGDDRLQPVSTVDAFGPGTDPGGAWYDEMLVGGDTVVVVGYSYARGGTELVLFDIAGSGALRYRDTYHLRSSDYYSARNYASRLIGQTLVFYTPMPLNAWSLARREFGPGLRRWRPDAPPAEFRRILPATRIYRADDGLDPFETSLALHTVTRCDLSAPRLDCSSSAVLGPSGRVFYVSADSVFVWTTAPGAGEANASSVFRIPLDDAAPTALKARGAPIDQLSFLHDADDHLNVLLSAAGAGEGMWGDESSAGGLALLRVPLSSFGDGRGAAPASAYRSLPGTADGAMQNRFVGDWLLYGAAPYRWRRTSDTDANPGTTAYAVRYAANDAVQSLRIGHGAERIEALGRDALLVGSAGGDLHFTSVRLGRQAATGMVYVQADAAQGESRTHGFFYRAESADRGIAGLPIVAQRRSNSMQRYLHESASVLYLRNRDLRLAPMGQLVADADRAVDDGCRASCVDWYGNARPIFIGERVFALLGYELVEGRIARERIIERRRTSFAPAAAVSE
ncbi:beta-propeller domain-containing protein [Luteimonas sp. R10]|uniref:beta-propeller domain-containing protein n=1 Tax=Luteimonas sp. R10 TaxID=3108176 RepID=UPI0030888FDB|nr:beta-propeller domain-containing protein [Luteimonas sp. R10]